MQDLDLTGNIFPHLNLATDSSPLRGEGSRSRPRKEAENESTLVGDLPYLEHLERLRIEARSLLRGGVRALVERTASRWEAIDTPTTEIYLRRAKHLAWTLGLLKKEESSNFPQLGRPSAKQPRNTAWTLRLKDGTDLFSDQADDIPSFHASSYMRTSLDEPDAYISSDLFLCFYKLIREIHTVDAPDWALGGVRTGGTSSEASTFLTSEAARALGYLANKLERTGEFLREVSDYETYVHEILSNRSHETRPLPEKWCQAELRRVSLGLASIVERDCDSVLLNLETDLPQDPKAVFRRLRSILKVFIAKTSKALSNALSLVDKHRNGEQNYTDRKIAINPSAKRELQRPLVLSHTAHTHARRSLSTMQDLLRDLSAQMNDSSTFCLAVVSRYFGGAAEGVRRNMEPIEVFLRSRLAISLLSTLQSGSSVEVQDIAFASVASGAISQHWSQPEFATVISTLTSSISLQGRFPKGQPFHTGGKGLERYAANAHVAHAFAYIAQNVPGPVKIAAVERLLLFFRDTAIRLKLQKNATGYGWSRSETSKGGDASPWLSTISCLALHRIEEMLKRKINECIFTHLTIKDPDSLSRVPSINELMCTDIGLSTVDWGARSRRMVTADLEAIRSHLHCRSAGRKEQTRRFRLSSIILYGPPGTGKTTLIESLAKSSRRSLVQVTPSDFLFLGAEGLERQARAVMRALCLLSGVIILFDEFDTILYSREQAEASPISTFEFLTGCMLPKLADLNRSAKERGSAFALATNFIERLDPAAIRPGRFDHKVCVLPPDVPSRICRLVAQINRWENLAPGTNELRAETSESEMRILDVIAQTARVPVSSICKPGWYTYPKHEFLPGQPWHYILFGSPEPSWPMPQAPGVPASDIETNEHVTAYAAEASAYQSFEVALKAYLRQQSRFDWKKCLNTLFSSAGVKRAVDTYQKRMDLIRAQRLDPMESD